MQLAPTVRVQKQFDHPDDTVDVEYRRRVELNLNWFTPAQVRDLPVDHLAHLDHLILSRQKEPYEITVISKRTHKNSVDNHLYFYNYEVKTRDGYLLYKGTTKQTVLNTTYMTMHDVTQQDVLKFEREYSCPVNCKGFMACICCCCCSCSYMSPSVNVKIEIQSPPYNTVCTVYPTGGTCSPTYTVCEETTGAEILLVEYDTGVVYDPSRRLRVGDLQKDIEGDNPDWVYHRINFDKDLNPQAKLGSLGVLLACTKFGYWGNDS